MRNGTLKRHAASDWVRKTGRHGGTYWLKRGTPDIPDARVYSVDNPGGSGADMEGQVTSQEGQQEQPAAQSQQAQRTSRRDPAGSLTESAKGWSFAYATNMGLTAAALASGKIDQRAAVKRVVEQARVLGAQVRKSLDRRVEYMAELAEKKGILEPQRLVEVANQWDKQTGDAIFAASQAILAKMMAGGDDVHPVAEQARRSIDQSVAQVAGQFGDVMMDMAKKVRRFAKRYLPANWQQTYLDKGVTKGGNRRLQNKTTGQTEYFIDQEGPKADAQQQPGAEAAKQPAEEQAVPRPLSQNLVESTKQKLTDGGYWLNSKSILDRYDDQDMDALGQHLGIDTTKMATHQKAQALLNKAHEGALERQTAKKAAGGVNQTLVAYTQKLIDSGSYWKSPQDITARFSDADVAHLITQFGSDPSKLKDDKARVNHLYLLAKQRAERKSGDGKHITTPTPQDAALPENYQPRAERARAIQKVKAEHAAEQKKQQAEAEKVKAEQTKQQQAESEAAQKNQEADAKKAKEAEVEAKKPGNLFNAARDKVLQAGGDINAAHAAGAAAVQEAEIEALNPGEVYSAAYRRALKSGKDPVTADRVARAKMDQTLAVKNQFYRQKAGIKDVPTETIMPEKLTPKQQKEQEAARKAEHEKRQQAIEAQADAQRRQVGEQQVAAGNVTAENIQYAPLHKLPDGVRGAIQARAQEMLAKTKRPAVQAALQKMIKDAGSDTGGDVEQLKEEIASDLTANPAVEKEAANIRQQHNEHIGAVAAMLKDARDRYAQMNPGKQLGRQMEAFRGGDYGSIPGFDALARSIAGEHRGLFESQGYESEGGVADETTTMEKLHEYLSQGTPQPMTQAEARKQALDRLGAESEDVAVAYAEDPIVAVFTSADRERLVDDAAKSIAGGEPNDLVKRLGQYLQESRGPKEADNPLAGEEDYYPDALDMLYGTLTPEQVQRVQKPVSEEVEEEGAPEESVGGSQFYMNPDAWKAEMMEMGFSQDEIDTSFESAVEAGIDPTKSDDLHSLGEYYTAVEEEAKESGLSMKEHLKSEAQPDMNKTPAAALRTAQEQAIAAGKTPVEAQQIGKAAAERVDAESQNPRNVYNRELEHGIEQGMSEERAMARARQIADRAYAERQHETPKSAAQLPATPEPRAELPFEESQIESWNPGNLGRIQNENIETADGRLLKVKKEPAGWSIGTRHGLDEWTATSMLNEMKAKVPKKLFEPVAETTAAPQEFELHRGVKEGVDPTSTTGTVGNALFYTAKKGAAQRHAGPGGKVHSTTVKATKPIQGESWKDVAFKIGSPWYEGDDLADKKQLVETARAKGYDLLQAGDEFIHIPAGIQMPPRVAKTGPAPKLEFPPPPPKQATLLGGEQASGEGQGGLFNRPQAATPKELPAEFEEPTPEELAEERKKNGMFVPKPLRDKIASGKKLTQAEQKQFEELTAQQRKPEVSKVEAAKPGQRAEPARARAEAEKAMKAFMDKEPIGTSKLSANDYQNRTWEIYNDKLKELGWTSKELKDYEINRMSQAMGQPQQPMESIKSKFLGATTPKPQAPKPQAGNVMKTGTGQPIPPNQTSIIRSIDRKVRDFEMNNPMGAAPGVMFRDRNIPQSVAKQFDAHGTGTIDSLRDLLNGGIDKSREFYSESLPAAGTPQYGTSLLKDTSPFVVLGHPGKSIKNGGIAAVVVDDLHSAHIEDFKRAFPGVKFFPARHIADTLIKVTRDQKGAAVQYSKATDDLAAAAQQVDVNPSPKQKEAGNYSLGHLSLQGLNISIENPKGSIRTKKGKDGEWSREMQSHYGYFKKTNSRDGDQVDVFVGPDPDSEIVFVVNQVTEAGRFDEVKCLLGWSNQKSAREGYLANYPAGWRCGEIIPMTIGQFKRWLERGDTKKPVKGMSP